MGVCTVGGRDRRQDRPAGRVQCRENWGWVMLNFIIICSIFHSNYELELGK